MIFDRRTFLATLAAAQYKGKTLIAHRGASAYAPENTLPAYALAIKQGADYVEQDLQITKDGVLVCLHDETLERTTNVKTVFPGRARSHVSQFTLDEIRRLDAGAWFGREFAGTRVPTWQEAIDAIGGRAGLYPETKAPETYGRRGFDMEKLVLETLRRNKLDKPGAPVILQSFSEASLRKMHFELGCRIPKLLLSRANDPVRALEEAREFAAGIGPEKTAVLNEPGLVRRAHDAGLSVTIWTCRARDEMSRYLYELGVDAIFTDNPDQFPRSQIAHLVTLSLPASRTHSDADCAPLRSRLGSETEPRP